MSRSFLLLLTMAAVWSSCSKSGVPVHQNVRGNVTFACSGWTKAGSSSVTDKVSTLDLLVFRKNGGALECYSRAAGDKVTANVTTGIPYVYYVVANARQNVLDACVSEAAFRQTVWPLSDIGAGMAMTGSGGGTFKDNDTILVGLDRIPAKVTIEGITPSFLQNAFKGAVIKLERLYLINVNGTSPYCGAASSGETWYNKLQRETLPHSLSDCLVKNTGKIISGTGKITEVFSFLCCPNPVDNGVNSLTEPVWSERNTRLVIEFSIDGIPNYYPIDMPAMSCNTNYIVRNAILLGPGSSSPDIPVDRTSLSFSITVNPWTKDTDKNIIF